MDNATFGFKNDFEFFRKLKQLGEKALPACGGSLYRSGQKIITRSKEVYCPVLTGTLRSTLTGGEPEYHGHTVSVKLSAGGPAAPYAAEVHENMNPGVNWTKPGTGPKYLETPMNEAVQEIMTDLRDDINEALEEYLGS